MRARHRNGSRNAWKTVVLEGEVVTEGVEQQGREAGGKRSRAPRPSPTLRRRLMVLARVGWLAVAAVALGQFIISVPARYAQLAHPTAGVRAALAEMGFSAGGYALYNVTLDTVFVSVFAVVAFVIFWRRSDDPMALLVATMLVVWGPLNGLFVLTPDATKGMYPAMQATLGSLVTFVGYMAWMLFFYLFPSGRFVPGWTRWMALSWVLFVSSWILTPFGPPSWPPALFNVAILVLWGSFPVAQLYRYARVSDATERQQTKWVVFGVAVAVVGVLATIHSGSSGRPSAGESRTEDAQHVADGCIHVVHSALHRGRGTARTPLRHRRDHKPYPRLRFSHCNIGARVLRGRNDDPVCPPNTHRPRGASPARHRGFYPCDSSLVQPHEASHPGLHRQALLPQQVRHEEDARSLLCQTEERDRPGGVERRPGRGCKGHDTTGPRLAVVAS